MRRSLILVVVILLTIGAFFGLVFLQVPLGEPRLRIEFYPPPPWQMRPEESLEVSVGVANDAWLLAWAKDVRVTVSVPEGFAISSTGTNECELDFFTLHGGDGLSNRFTVVASNNISLGNYTITIRVLGENVPEQVHTPQVAVLAL